MGARRNYWHPKLIIPFIRPRNPLINSALLAVPRYDKV